MLGLLTLLLAPSPAMLPPDPPTLIRQEGREGRDHQDGEDHEDDHDRGRDRDERAWRREHREEEHAWRQWARHHDEGERDEDRGWSFDHPRHAHLAPPWMTLWWGARPGPRYVALVPHDPSRCYVFLDGRWVLRRVRDVGFQADLDDVMRLPAAPPPIPLPHVGLDLHVVLFD